MDQETPDHPGMASLDDGTLPARMGVKIGELSAGRVTGSMPVTGNTQPSGVLHGGACCVLTETLGTLGSALHAGSGSAAACIEISATHHRAVRDGEVTGAATLVHGGRTLARYEIVITDGDGRRVCTSRVTCLIRGHGD